MLCRLAHGPAVAVIDEQCNQSLNNPLPTELQI
jgi:hypothetical protein